MELLKSAMPGTLPFLLLSLAVALGLMSLTRWARWGRRWLAVVLVMYWVLSTPAGSEGLAALLARGFQPIASRDAAAGAAAIIVLDGGTARCDAGGGLIETVNRPSALRAIEAIRVYRLLDRPLVVVSGGRFEGRPQWAPEADVIRRELVRAGIPLEHTVLDTTSRNTREHAEHLVPLLRARGISRFVLVTSPTHMRRAVRAFRKQGADPIASISSCLCGEGTRGWRRYWPAGEALALSVEAVHDSLGLGYYWIRGWA